MSDSLVTDPSGNPLKLGSSARYISADTMGNIVEIVTDDDGKLAFVKNTRLYYVPDILTVINTFEEKFSEENIVTVEEMNGALEQPNEFFHTEMDISCGEFDS